MLYRYLFRPILFQQDPEWVHEQILSLGERLESNASLRLLIAKWTAPTIHSELRQTFFGYPFNNPIGLAAGFDKNIRLLKTVRALGFGFEEVGSISARPCLGNSRPRLFRLPKDEAIINRMGLNNFGVEALLPQIQQLPPNWPVGISIVKTHDPAILGDAAINDFKTVLRAVHGHGAYVSINISCPNTREGKTFEDPDALDGLLKSLREEELETQASLGRSARPWLLKISPDLSGTQLQEVFEIACQYRISGWVATNTTPLREGLKTAPQKINTLGAGGLSGRPLQSRSTHILGELYQLKKVKNQEEMLLIGVGGIHDVNSAWEKIIHGASLLQIYTGLVYQGPGLIRTIHNGLLNKLKIHGLSHIEDAVGLAFR